MVRAPGVRPACQNSRRTRPATQSPHLHHDRLHHRACHRPDRESSFHASRYRCTPVAVRETLSTERPPTRWTVNPLMSMPYRDQTPDGIQPVGGVGFQWQAVLCRQPVDLADLARSGSVALRIPGYSRLPAGFCRGCLTSTTDTRHNRYQIPTRPRPDPRESAAAVRASDVTDSPPRSTRSDDPPGNQHKPCPPAVKLSPKSSFRPPALRSPLTQQLQIRYCRPLLQRPTDREVPAGLQQKKLECDSHGWTTYDRGHFRANRTAGHAGQPA